MAIKVKRKESRLDSVTPTVITIDEKKADILR